MTPPMAEALNLKPCPFCGGAAEIYQVGNDHLKRRGFEVKCTTWGCSTKKTALVIRHTLHDARRFAVEAWNRRSEPEAARPPEALEGLIERLEGQVRYKYMPAAVRTSLEEAAQALRLLGEVEKALEASNEVMAMLIDPKSIKKTSVLYAWAQAVEAELKTRSALDKIRKGMGA